MSNHASAPARGVSRRTLLTGAAWSVPAVLVVGATPAFALSTGRLTAVSATAVRGTKDITINFVVRNPNSHDIITIHSVTVTAQTNSADVTSTTVVSSPIVPTQVSPGDYTIVFSQTANNNGKTVNTAQFTFAVTYTIGTQFTDTYTVNSGTVARNSSQTLTFA